tara:strand:+ start:155 stop:379 length:225 start_codon:yes stop_codon:yes gene_type:complete
MMRYSWPGNIRELENFVENIIIISDDEKIGVCDLPEEIREYVTNGYVLDADALGISIKTLYNKLKVYNIHYDIK